MKGKAERFYFMDSMRATLMILGVVLHSSQIFNPEKSWVIYSHNTDPLMTYIVSIIATFRMPAFFVVSGYFCFLTLKKYKIKKFLTVRLKRLIIPFLFTALIINSIQAVFLNWSGWYSFDFYRYIVSGGYVSHLWFLINLLIYFLFIGLIVTFFEPVAKLGVKLARQILHKISMLLVVIAMPILSVAILTLNKIDFPLYSTFFGVLNIFSIISYSPFFIFGIALATHRSFLHRFCTINPIACFVFILVSLIAVNLVSGMEGLLFKVMDDYFTTLSKWLSISLCFFIFHGFCNKKSKFMGMLSDSAYSVYLFHHLFVVFFGILLIYLDFSAILGCFTLIFFTTTLTILIHNYLISKNKILLFMFNGK